MPISWGEGRVAVVTGAGNGLGRTYALLLGSRGVKVVVNDLGGGHTGEGHSGGPADKVVAEIKAAGGEAVANYDSVVEGEKVVQTALDTWGRVDIVVNNAGILRDTSLSKMTDKDWSLIQDIHLNACYRMTKAAWETMRKQKFGRIINVTSAAGIYGNFGQTNYSAAKLGIAGFTFGCAREGASKNIKVNVIAPLAGSRMTQTVMPPDLVEKLKPEYVAPFVAYLASDDCEPSGGIFEIGAGWIAKLRWQRAKGAFFDIASGPMTPEMVAEGYATVEDFDDGEAEYPESTQDSFGPVMEGLSKL
jgi:NAD(P)-dependent dehydrogenase (short-subunit alcohol dehydrogenase family)